MVGTAICYGFPTTFLNCVKPDRCDREHPRPETTEAGLRFRKAIDAIHSVKTLSLAHTWLNIHMADFSTTKRNYPASVASPQEVPRSRLELRMPMVNKFSSPHEDCRRSPDSLSALLHVVITVEC